MDNKLKLVIFAHARSGSSSLYKILQLHPALNIAHDLVDTYQNLAPLPIHELEEIVEWDYESMTMYGQVVDRRPKGSCVKLWYKELYTPDVEANKRVLQPVFDMLDLEMPETVELDRLLDPAITKLNSEETYRLVPNADEINEKLGSDKTGWLFDTPLPR